MMPYLARHKESPRVSCPCSAVLRFGCWHINCCPCALVKLMLMLWAVLVMAPVIQKKLFLSSLLLWAEKENLYGNWCPDLSGSFFRVCDEKCSFGWQKLGPEMVKMQQRLFPLFKTCVISRLEHLMSTWPPHRVTWQWAVWPCGHLPAFYTATVEQTVIVRVYMSSFLWKLFIGGGGEVD